MLLMISTFLDRKQTSECFFAKTSYRWKQYRSGNGHVWWLFPFFWSCASNASSKKRVRVGWRRDWGSVWWGGSGCGWLWLALVGCGWLWLAVAGCGWLWLAVADVV
jgi:hypothetical protein